MGSENTKFKKFLLKWISFCLVLTLCLSLFLSCQSRQNVLKEKWRKNPCLEIRFWGWGQARCEKKEFFITEWMISPNS